MSFIDPRVSDPMILNGNRNFRSLELSQFLGAKVPAFVLKVISADQTTAI